MDIINQEREDVGLCSLDCYDDYLDENLIESSFMNDIVREFEKINKLYEEYEEIAIVYDELLSVIKDAESSEVIKKLSHNVSPFKIILNGIILILFSLRFNSILNANLAICFSRFVLVSK